MKKFWKIGLVILPVAIGATACLVACGKDDPETPAHTHTYNTAWEKDANYHWHKASCEHTDEVADKAAHAFSDEYEFNSSKHWYECSVCEYKKEEADHELKNGVCDCGYVDPAIRLVYTLVNNEYTVSVNPVALNDKSFTSVEIPSEYEGKKVRGIAENGFNGVKYLKQITLPNTITHIGDYAFGDCESLTGIELPNNLQQLGNQVFSGCKELTGTVRLPVGVTVIGENLFLNCGKLKAVEFAANTTRIGTQAFANCKSLTSVTIPETVTYIGLKAFKGTGLTQVTVPESVKTLYSYAFEDCTALTSATVLADIEYVTGSWFSGCTALQTLTLPFLGQDVRPLDVERTALGFAFGTNEYGTSETVAEVVQNEVTYYIPKSLANLTILGGYIKAGAFDGCSMLKTVTLKADVVAEADKFEGCTANFITESDPTVSSVKYLKGDATVGEARVGEELKLSYNASKFATVTVAVKKDGGAAAQSDFEYDAETGAITFKTVGSFTVTVKAANGEKEATASATIEVTLTPPALGEVNLTPATAELDNGSAATTVAYTVDDESVVTVTVKKDGAAVDGAYDGSTGAVTVSAAGVYTIEVKAVRNGITVTKSAIFTVSDANAAQPVITVTAAEATVYEGTGTVVTASAEYAAGATKKDEVFTFYTKNGSNFENADTNDYDWNESTKTFTPKVAGTYKVDFTAITAEGGKGQNSVEITANAVDIQLDFEATLTNGWVRTLVNTNKDITYTVTGYAGGYNVSYEKDVADATITASADKTVTLSLDAPNTVNYKVVYTHKTVANKKVELLIPVSFVSDENAPVLGTDPFADGVATLITSTGLQLYYDVTSGGEQVAAANVTYTIVDSNLKFGDGSAVASDRVVLGKIQGRSYLLVKNYANDDGDSKGNTATGTVTVKLTATVDDKTAAATKTFTVIKVGTNNSGLNNYLKKYFDIDNTNYDAAMSNKNRENMTVTKEGILFNSGSWGDGDLFSVNVGGKDSFQLDFTYEIIERLGDNNKASFALQYVTGQYSLTAKKHDSQTAFYTENDAVDITSYSWGGFDDGSREVGTKPLASSGKLYIRLTHTVANSKATFWWQWSSNGTDYNDWYSYTAASSNSAGNMGAKVQSVKFYHEAGRYLMSPVTVSNL